MSRPKPKIKTNKLKPKAMMPAKKARRPRVKNTISSSEQVGAAVAYSQRIKGSVPIIKADRNSCRIIHRELISPFNVGSAVPFNVTNTFQINPGLNATFPWLSTQAQNWEMYRFNKLRFVFITASPTTQSGSVALIPDYDSADPAPASFMEASSFEDFIEDVAWKRITCDLKPSAMFPMGPRKFVRTNALAANLDIKTYDCGQIFVVANNADGALGNIWAEYDITLHVPTIIPGITAVYQHIISAAAPTSADILNTGDGYTGTNIVSVAGSVITFLSAGSYFLSYYATATTTITQTAVPSVDGTAAVFIDAYNSVGYASAGSATTKYLLNCAITTSVGGTLTLDNTVVAGLTAELVVTNCTRNFS
jgi:hypothetical protein